MDMQHSSRLRSPLGPCAVVGLVMALCLVSEARAVVTITSGYSGNRSVTMRVGTPTAGSVDTVQFNVDGATVGNSLTPAASVNGNGTAIAASSGGVVIAMSMSVPTNRTPQSMTTTVTSPASLTCVAGGCGSATIPFSAISWTVTATSPASNDFQDGTFIGGPAQPLIAYTLQSAGTFDARSTLSFRYANTTAYPAGTYTGTVTYTATLP